MPGKSGFGATRQAAHVHIQQLKTSLVVVSIAAAVVPVDQIQRVLHLANIVARAGIQGLLDHRLLDARTSTKGFLQSRIGSQDGY